MTDQQEAGATVAEEQQSDTVIESVQPPISAVSESQTAIEGVVIDRPVVQYNGGTLYPWTKGTSGNPAGRPKSLRRALQEQTSETDLGKMARAVNRKAKSGSIKHLEFWRDTVEGKPEQRISHSLEDSPLLALMAGWKEAEQESE